MPLAVDPDATRLMASIRSDDRRAMDSLLLSHPRVATSRGALGATPLMAAALYGDAALVRRLLAAGASPTPPTPQG